MYSSCVDNTRSPSGVQYKGKLEDGELLGNMCNQIYEGDSIEALVMRTASEQRKFARQMSMLRMKTQWKLVKAAAEKIKDISWLGVFSAVLGVVAQLCGIPSQAVDCITSIMSGEENAKLETLRGAAGIEGQLTSQSGDLLETARSLEQGMLRHLEKMNEYRSQALQTIINRLG